MKDNTPLLAAGLSFYSVLSMAPALWLVVAIAGAIVGRESARMRLLEWTTSMAGPRVAMVVSSLADRVEESSPLATVLGLVTMLFGATMVFGALHDILNRVWNVPPKQRSAWGMVRGYFFKRLLASGVIVLVGLLILLSLVAEAALNAMLNFAPDVVPAPELVLRFANAAISAGTIFLLFAGIYRFLHSTALDWRDVWMGAGVTALLFTFGKILIGLYLGRGGLTSVYGAAGSLLVVLLWVYYSAQIFLFGAELTEVYARHRELHKGARGKARGEATSLAEETPSKG